MRKIIQTILFILFATIVSFGQSKPNYLNIDDGLNPILFNGKDYTFFVSSSIEGHQFFETKEYIKGSALIKGKIYNNLSLNYDLYNQQVLLKYKDGRGSINIIELSKAWLENFTINGYFFVLKEFPDKQKKILQVIGEEGINLYIYWQKSMKFKAESSSAYYYFTKPLRLIYIQNNQQLYKIKSKKDFLLAFGAEFKVDIKKYIKQHKVKLKKAGIVELENLMNYCNTL